MEKREIRVTLLGNCTISYGNLTLTDSEGMRENQSWTLLSYLLLRHESSLSPAELQTVLGESFDREKYANAIRVRLHRSRALLEQVGLGNAKTGLLLYRKKRFLVNPEYALTTDTEDVEAAYAQLLAEGQSRSQLLQRCMDAVGFYNGPFLQNASELPWIVEQRQHYERIFGSIAATAMGLMETEKDFSRTEQLCRRMILICPKNMELHTRMLRMLLRCKLMGEAANHYAHLAVRLAGTDLPLPDFRELMA